MRTLLIDNYDSYTYNLFQLIAEVNGAEPVVITNDAPATDVPELSDFDNVVVSPGPGHPGRARDFGIATDVLERSEIPVLGVCLGHQGIGLGAGAAVVPAPQPRHGYLSTVRHHDEDVFAGLPQDFTAVRYHSLSVAEPLPPELEATAWSEDGVIMGLRHRTRPLWGVQFHPESVCTEYGRQLLANFRDLTLRRGTRTPADRAPAPTSPAAPPAPATPKAQAPGVRPDEPSAGLRVHLRTIETAVDTEAAFTHLYSDSAAPAFWLDSAHVEPGRSRFSFMGDASGPLAELVRYRTGENAVVVERAGHPARPVPGDIFDYLQRQLRRRRVDLTDVPFDFSGGYVGYFGYELKGDLGSVNRHTSPVPDAMWLFVDRFVVVDHFEECTYVVALSDPDTEVAAARWADAAVASLLSLPPVPPVPPPPGTDAGSWLLHDREQYRARIAEIQRYLHAGESYEVCLTTSAWLPAADGDGYAYYRALRRLNPAPYAAYLRLGDVEVASSSPERFLSIDRSRVVETKPIKGTVHRSPDPQEDVRLRDSLAADAKTRAENLMIVDLLRNDLGRVCEIGSVHVPRLMAAETYTTVHQLVSTVCGRVRPENDVIDVVRACFPGGSMTGAPKLRTMEIIDSLEDEARGVYSGAIGFLSTNGTADLNIVIRTAVRSDGRWRVGAGGAIVLDSDADAEYDEVLLKAAAPLRAHAAGETADSAQVPLPG
ncbi:aminodeoxychorismate synthase [Streptomyces chumphonensis]|uniref:aminodeoxychorismate synthase n=1 Tax=Streptomyces chumphonensis TaxID=1214925 RepID=UPI003D7061E4